VLGADWHAAAGSVASLALSPLRLADDTRPLHFDDRIVAVDGVPVASATEVRAAVELEAPSAAAS